MAAFKDSVLKELNNITMAYHAQLKEEKEKEERLAKTKEIYKNLKKENDELNRKLSDLQDRVAKSIDHM